MALVRVSGDLLCPTSSAADDVLTLLTDKLVQRVPASVLRPAVVVQRGDGWHVYFCVQYLTRADGDDVRDTLQARWTTGGLRNRFLVGSTVTTHVCPHTDGLGGDCTSVEFEYVEAVK